MMRGVGRSVAWGLVVLGFGWGLSRVDAGPLDPTLPIFTSQSQGDVVLNSGTYVFTLGTSGPSLQMYNGPVFTTVATGFLYNGINVFDFHSLQIQAGATISVQQSAASGPIALLSSTSIAMGGTINLTDPTAATNPGATSRFNGGNGASGTNGANGPGGVVLTGGGGGGFGGAGQSASSAPIYQNGNGPLTGYLPGGVGGGTYTSLTNQLIGGSAGGDGGGVTSGVPLSLGRGGHGGGAIELGAVGLVSVSGMINVNGGDGESGSTSAVGGGGGGSGGGVLIHGTSVNLSGTISALGGAGGLGNMSNGGAGGGGIVTVLASGPAGSFVNTGNVLVGNGVFQAVVPEPSSLVLLGIATLGGLVAARSRRGR